MCSIACSVVNCFPAMTSIVSRPFFASRRRPEHVHPSRGKCKFDRSFETERRIGADMMKITLDFHSDERRSSPFWIGWRGPFQRTDSKLPAACRWSAHPGADPDLGSARPLTAGLCGPRGDPSAMSAFFVGRAAPDWEEGATVTTRRLTARLLAYPNFARAPKKEPKGLGPQGARWAKKDINDLYPPSSRVRKRS